MAKKGAISARVIRLRYAGACAGGRLARELLGQVRQHLYWHVQRLGRERAEPADRRQLQGKTQPVMHPTALGDQFLVDVVEEVAGSFQFGPLWCVGVPAEGHNLVIYQRFDRYGPIG